MSAAAGQPQTQPETSSVTQGAQVSIEAGHPAEVPPPAGARKTVAAGSLLSNRRLGQGIDAAAEAESTAILNLPEVNYDKFKKIRECQASDA
jgi:hypothetical protein